MWRSNYANRYQTKVTFGSGNKIIDELDDLSNQRKSNKSLSYFVIY